MTKNRKIILFFNQSTQQPNHFNEGKENYNHKKKKTF